MLWLPRLTNPLFGLGILMGFVDEFKISISRNKYLEKKENKLLWSGAEEKTGGLGNRLARLREEEVGYLWVLLLERSCVLS